ncbi:DUF4003 domain-containing protein [Rossellomorea vietnamensis]|uniref:DUF4003 domain-containing protein n=1 Tax=Rossellomorea vietnamensis TaxID=218284 RepID=A0A5D4MEA2_9BACI|nr:DUF4003 family protein [Rossellomorea vietnamensis]TYR99787.1 DUF4003 domain-containing protein [Rossellomorea vietnamensis]
MNDAMEKVDRYKAIYSQLKSNLRWKVSDNRTLMMAASLYVTSQREFDIDRFQRLGDFIKNEVGIFSTLKSQLRFTIAAMLDTRFDNPEAAFADFSESYEILIREGFTRGVYSYIAAVVLCVHESKEEAASLAMDIYKKMREEHFFLTGQSDYPLAMLLAERNQEIDSLIVRIEDFYNTLDQAGFRKGNDLQSMSHILSLHENPDQKQLIARCTHLFDGMRQLDIRPKASLYPQLAVLSFLSDSENHLMAVKEIWETLNAEKLFKWHKDINFMMAVSFYIADKIEHSSMVETSLYTTMETLIQAQQAASVAAISGAAAAAGAAGGGSD